MEAALEERRFYIFNLCRNIYKCSDLYYHMNVSAVRHNRLASSFVKKGEFLSYTTVRCQRKKLEKLEEYIKSPWGC